LVVLAESGDLVVERIEALAERLAGSPLASRHRSGPGQAEGTKALDLGSHVGVAVEPGAGHPGLGRHGPEGDLATLLIEASDGGPGGVKGVGSPGGGGPEQNARIAREVLAGGNGPRRDVVLLNAAAALRAAGIAKDWKDGIKTAADAIDSGRAGKTLERWATISQA